MHKPEKLSFTPLPLNNLIDNTLNIVNNFLKEIQERNQSKLSISTLLVLDNPFILKESYSKIEYNYKQLNSKSFVKAAKPIQKVIVLKTYKKALVGLYFKE